MRAIRVQDSSEVAHARQQAADLAKRHSFDEADTGRVALIATELATNLIKHGNGGEMLVGTFDDTDGRGIQLLALDRGRGMVDLAACLADGFSSTGTLGHGLGAVIRQSQVFDVASWPGLGTAVLSRVGAGARGRQDGASPRWGAVSIAKAGEEVCGDGWSVSPAAAGLTLLVADGLGHGPEAADAANEAVRLFHRFNGHQIGTLLDYIHGGLRATRGAAVSIARFDEAGGRLMYSGIGNVAGVLSTSSGLRRMVSMPGTAGYNVRKIQAFEYPMQPGLVILHSDGLQSSWTLERYTNLSSRHPALIAAVLYRDLSRGRDDATVLVAKW